MNLHHNRVPLPNASGEEHFLARPAWMSEGYYARRRVDPLEVAFPNPLAREQLVNYADAQTEGSARFLNSGEAMQFRLDALYRVMPLEPATATAGRIRQLASLMERRLGANNISEVEKLTLKMRLIDLGGIQAFRSYQDAPENSDAATNRSSLALLEATCTTQVKMGASLLAESVKNYETITDEESRQDLRGKMFELFFITNLRRKLLANEEYDTAMFALATDFEDSSSAIFSPRHNYDIIGFDQAGETTDLFQCKNAESKLEYAPPIQVVRGNAFTRFMEEPEKYTNALSILVENRPDIPESTMTRFEKEIDDLLDSGTGAVMQLGRLAAS